MDDFKIIVEGYARPGKSDKEFYASCTTTLLYSKDLKVLVDPGADRDLLLKNLDKEGLNTSDIDILFLTHWHPDHFLNIKLFPGHDIVDATTIWKNDGEEYFPASDEVMSKIPGTNIKILSTPGHREEHASLLVRTEKKGIVCVAQDVFWWTDSDQPAKPTLADLLDLGRSISCG
ncbi:MAG: MBL fold metallo-hydrolase [Patescibacteria group bacterium]|nr:MBL fold metallo-hydrolase [Patescibacteria group bacterium]